jgi:DNA-binding Xre family transcriptional regulator
MTTEKQLDKLKKEVTKRLYSLFMDKYEGNKSKFAKDAGCDEKTIRLVFDEGQGMTVNLMFKLCHALDVSPSELLKDLELSQYGAVSSSLSIAAENSPQYSIKNSKRKRPGAKKGTSK